MITKEAIEAARISIMEVFQLGNCGDLQAEAVLTAAFAAMPVPAVNDFALPQDVIDSLIAIGPVEWGVSLTQSDEKHAALTMIAMIEKRMADAERVIEPFARLAGEYDPPEDDDNDLPFDLCHGDMTIGQLRAARAYMEGK